MIFDWTINVGNIIQLFAFIGGGLWLFFSMRSDIQMLRLDFKHIEEKQLVLNEAFTQLGRVLTQVAVQDTRINMIEKNVDELRHGKGYIDIA